MISCNSASNKVLTLKLAEPGFAPRFSGEEKSIKTEALCRGLTVIDTPNRGEFIIVNDVDCVLFRGNIEPYLSYKLHARHNCKFETKKLLSTLGISVPVGYLIAPNSEKELLKLYNGLDAHSVVIKPAALNQAQGVYTDIKDEEQLLKAYANISKYIVILEEHIAGSEYRLLVVGGRVVAAAYRIPAHVVGDGSKTVGQLIDEKNERRKLSEAHRYKLIAVDDEVESLLQDQGINLSFIPSHGCKVQLRKIVNRSIGGDTQDATDQVDESFIKIAERIWSLYPTRALYGVDLIAEDISRPANEQRYAVIEVNNRPNLAGMHINPTIGEGRDVVSKIIDYVFPSTGEAKPKAVFTEPVQYKGRYQKRYVVHGILQNTGYRKWIKDEALKANLSGLCRYLKSGKMEIVVSSTDYNAVNDFKYVCAKGPRKARVMNIVEKVYNKPLGEGFIIRQSEEEKIKSKYEKLKNENAKLETKYVQVKHKYSKIKQSRLWRYGNYIKKIMKPLI